MATPPQGGIAISIIVIVIFIPTSLMRSESELT